MPASSGDERERPPSGYALAQNRRFIAQTAVTACRGEEQLFQRPAGLGAFFWFLSVDFADMFLCLRTPGLLSCAAQASLACPMTRIIFVRFIPRLAHGFSTQEIHHWSLDGK